MSAGEAIIILSALTALGSAIFRGANESLLVRFSRLMTVVTFTLLTLALFLLTYYFLTSDVSYLYVWSYSSSDLDTVYKLSGVWAGASGSFLLWTWMMSLVLLLETLAEPRRDYLSSKFHTIFQSTMAAVVAAFALILVDMDLFAETAPQQLLLRPGGSGLSMLLQTPEMVIHPPVVFAGYAFCIAVLAASVAYFLTRDDNWSMVSLLWGRLGWMFLTLGIGIGAIWAYYVLGWGGYWAWDPVETASLVPWIAATAFLHTQLRHLRKKEYSILSPTLGMLTFVAVLFATFATRAGSIWESSVHAFPGGVGDTAIGRLNYILSNDSTVLEIFTLMLVLLAISFYLAYRKYSSLPKPDEAPEPDRVSDYISDKNNMMLTVALLLITGLVMLLIMFKNTGSSQEDNYTEFNQKMSIFFVALMITMTVCLVWKSLGKERAFWAAIGIVVASVVLAIAATLTDFGNGLVALSLPSYAVAVVSSSIRIAKAFNVRSIRTVAQTAAPHIVHLGIALVFLSYVVSSNLQTYPSDGDSNGSVTVLAGESVSVGGYDVSLVSVDAEVQNTSAGTVAVTTAVIDIAKDGTVINEGLVLENHYSWIGGQWQVDEADVRIEKSVLSDLYLSFEYENETSATLSMKVIPMMNFLWGGLGLLVAGLAIRTSAWTQGLKPFERPKKGRRGTPKK